MKIKKIFVLALSMAMLTGCTSSVIELGDNTDENNADNISQEENDNLNSSNSSDEKKVKLTLNQAVVIKMIMTTPCGILQWLNMFRSRHIHTI